MTAEQRLAIYSTATVATVTSPLEMEFKFWNNTYRHILFIVYIVGITNK